MTTQNERLLEMRRRYAEARKGGTSPVNVDAVDMVMFPRVAEAAYARVELHAGDMLFIPKNYYHQVGTRLRGCAAAAAARVWLLLLFFLPLLVGFPRANLQTVAVTATVLRLPFPASRCTPRAEVHGATSR